jgi:hypothetical protein
VIVYGDRERVEPLADVLARIRELLGRSERSEPERRQAHAAELAIECGKLAQGLLDRELDARGAEELTPLSAACARLCLAAGRHFLGAPMADIREQLARCEGLAGDWVLCLREPEGYAFYALYPELYVQAARALEPEKQVQVIGIRSIGTSLAGFVAAALDSSRLPFSVRPTGHPFARELRIGEPLAAALLRDCSDTLFVVVDEGPGMSGSSFSAVARWLLEHGVPLPQIALLPSHAGEPGAESPAAVRELYRELPRSYVPFEQAIEPRVASWFADTTGELREPPLDIAGGRWRALLYPGGAPYPASHVRDERRKYVLRGEREWLMKYVGLGAGSRAIVARLRALSDAGFTPELASARHGFVLSRWLSGARPLPLAELDRSALVEQVGHYLAFLALRFPVSARDAGAAPLQLFELLTHNATELLGEERARALDRYRAALPMLTASQRPTATDNKLDAHEWLVLDDGRLRKCDAEAHHAAHDCIGAQDPAWDVAGASIELALSEPERELVIRALHDGANVRVDLLKLRFYELAYLAFRAGYAHYAQRALEPVAPADAARFAEQKRRYGERLSELTSADR